MGSARSTVKCTELGFLINQEPLKDIKILCGINEFDSSRRQAMLCGLLLLRRGEWRRRSADVQASCKRSDETSGPIKCAKFLDWMGNS